LFIEPRFSLLQHSSLSIGAASSEEDDEAEDSEAEITYTQFRSTFHRTVILGGPGGGKSTTIQNICYEFSKALLLAIDFPDRDSIDPFRQRIPIRVILRSFESKRSENRSLGVSEFIVDELYVLIDESREKVELFLRYSLATGTAIILFDGLDEVLGVGSRRNYVELVEQFANQFPATAVLVTSRHVGYLDSPPVSRFQMFIFGASRA
jgi:predicted NACHT family NTPase